MAVLRRQILNIPLNELEDVEKTFARMTSLDINDVPDQFLELFENTRHMAYRDYTISGVFQSFPIQGTFNGSIMLANGSLLQVGTTSEIFADAFELGFLVASLKEHGETSPDNWTKSLAAGSSGTLVSEDNKQLLQDLFMDAWGTALIGSGEKWLTEFIRKKVIDLGLFMTNSFGPGQGDIPLEMQAILLEDLKASEIGVSLSPHFIMSPQKSVTGIFGIQKEELTDLLRPCDLCNLSGTCPTAYA